MEKKDTYRILAKDRKINNNTWVTGLNNNDVIIGPAGAGKTRGYVLPNLLQTEESVIVADTKGNIADIVIPHLRKKGYRCKTMDFTGHHSSNGYNPFDFIEYDEKQDKYSQKDIKTIATVMVPQESIDDPFWCYAARMYLESLIAYVLECLPKEEHNLTSVLKLFGTMNTNVFQRLFLELSELDSESYAVNIYQLYRSNEKAEKMHESIRGILAEKLLVFSMDYVKRLFHKKNKIDFREMGKHKTALFLTISDTDRSMDRLTNLFYTQALHELCNSADQDYKNHRLAVPVRVILDDFAANVYIPDFDKIISIIRSREVSVSIILQSLSQLESMYGGARAKTILNNCDHCLYLGGQDVDTAKYMSIKTNKSINSILNMQLNAAWMFERGTQPQQVEKYRL